MVQRFFVEKENITDGKIVISGEDAKHLKQVLRAKIGDEIEICDGKGLIYACRISAVTPRVECIIGDIREAQDEPSVEITLYQGLPKADKFELIVQKGTELGINRFVPLITTNTVVKWKEEKSAARISRWQRIAYEAAKQSKREVIPKVCEPVGYGDMLFHFKNHDLVLFLWEGERVRSLQSVLRTKGALKKVAIVIGPEGGFTSQEVEEAVEAGGQTVTLGPRILRTETAGLIVAGIILYETGNLGG
jgi:16S rRNA (uracil1498-N3)-methyltransferase